MAGTVAVKLNGTDIWNGIKTNILITSGKVIAIILDNEAMANHFQGRADLWSCSINKRRTW